MYTLTINASNPSELAAAIAGLTDGIAVPQPSKTTKVDKVLKEESITDKAIMEQPETVTSVNSEVTTEMVREAVQAIAKAGKKDDVKKLLTKYGAENVTSLDSAKYAEFLEELKNL